MSSKGKFGGYAVVDAGVRYQISKILSLDLQAKNLAGGKYEYVWYDNFFWGGADLPMYSPAPGRSANLKL